MSNMCARFIFSLAIILNLLYVSVATEMCESTEDIGEKISKISLQNERTMNEQLYDEAMKGIEYVSNVIGERVRNSRKGLSEDGDCGDGVEGLLTLLTNCLYDISSEGAAGKVLSSQQIETKKYEKLEEEFGRIKFGYY